MLPKPRQSETSCHRTDSTSGLAAHFGLAYHHSASFTGSGSVSANLTYLHKTNADLIGKGLATARISTILTATSALIGRGTTAGQADLILKASTALVGKGSLSPTNILQILQAKVALEGKAYLGASLDPDRVKLLGYGRLVASPLVFPVGVIRVASAHLGTPSIRPIQQAA